MLNVVKQLSFVVMAVTVGTVVVLIVLGFQDIANANPFLQQRNGPRGHSENAVTQDEKIHPLVTQAHLFALRIDPPEVVIETRRPPDETRTIEQGGRKSETVIPDIKVDPPPARFDLLATVLYESAPEKSLALFQSGSKQQWFRCGETVDRYRICEIKDGRVLVSQPSGNPHEMTVPAKPHLASLIKSH